MKTPCLIAAALLSCALFSGCVMGRRTVALAVPTTPAPASPKGEFVVNSAEDLRHFEDKPASPDTPSVDGVVSSKSKEELAGMIGRQRNTYGKAMGDIALPAPATVQTKTIELIEEGLRRSGYTIAKGSASANTASAKIDSFWAWFTPGMWSVGFEARVECHITITHGNKTATLYVQGRGENRGQVASDANWQLAYSRAFDDFLNNFQSAMKREGF
jgi:hypothetical protein